MAKKKLKLNLADAISRLRPLGKHRYCLLGFWEAGHHTMFEAEAKLFVDYLNRNGGDAEILSHQRWFWYYSSHQESIDDGFRNHSILKLDDKAILIINNQRK